MAIAIKDKTKDNVHSWVTALACCFINCMLYGVLRLSGLLLISFVDKFGISRFSAALPFSLCSAIRNFSGPFVGCLGNSFGVRPVIITGCIIASTGIGLCFFASDIIWITINWGIVFGIGLGLSTSLLPCAINQNFNRQLSSASGLSYSGSFIGSFIFPPLLTFLLNTYDLPGTHLIIAAITLNSLVAAILLKTPKRKRKCSTDITPKNLNSCIPRSQINNEYINDTAESLSNNKKSFMKANQQPDQEISTFLNDNKNSFTSLVDASNIKNNNNNENLEKFDCCSLEKIEDNTPSSYFTGNQNFTEFHKNLSAFVKFHKLAEKKQLCASNGVRPQFLFAYHKADDISPIFKCPIYEQGSFKIYVDKHCETSNICCVRNIHIKKNNLLKLKILKLKKPNRWKTSCLMKRFKQNKCCKFKIYIKSILSKRLWKMKITFLLKSYIDSLYSLLQETTVNRKNSITVILNRCSKHFLKFSVPVHFSNFKENKAGNLKCYSFETKATLSSDMRNGCRNFAKYENVEKCDESKNYICKTRVTGKKEDTAGIISKTYAVQLCCENCEYEFRKTNLIFPCTTTTNNDNRISTNSKNDNTKVIASKSANISNGQIQQNLVNCIKIYCDPVFFVISTTMSLYSFILSSMLTIIEDFAKDLNIPKKEISYVLMALSAADLFGTLCLGWITDRQILSRSHFTTFCFLGMSITTFFISSSTNFSSLLALLIAYGVCESGIITMFPLLILQFVSSEKQSIAVASSNLLSAPSALLVPVVVGYFRDQHGCYNGLFHLLSVISLLCSVVWLGLPCVLKRREIRPSEGNKTEGQV